MDVLGIRFDALRLSQVVSFVSDSIRDQTPSQICLVNAYSVSLCWKHPNYRTVIDRSSLVLADGMSLVWGGRWLGVHLPGRVAGPDLTEALCALAERDALRVYFLGSDSSTLSAMKERLHQKWPRLHLAGMHSPSMCERLSSTESQDIIHRIRETHPDILFVGMSAPKQELWISEHLSALQVPVCIGIGAAFDFISGRVPRAPVLLQRAGLEWLYRLYCEPRRLWKRYLLGNFLFLSHLGWTVIRRMTSRRT